MRCSPDFDLQIPPTFARFLPKVETERAKKEDPSSPLLGPSKPGCPAQRRETHSLASCIG